MAVALLVWALLLPFFGCFFGSFPRARIIRTEYDREVLYFPFIAIPLLYYYIYYIPILPPFYFYILLSPPCYIIYIPPFFIFSPPSVLCYIVIIYLYSPRRRFFLFPRVYIDIILYISRLDTVLYLPPVDNVLLYYFPAVACLFSVSGRVCRRCVGGLAPGIFGGSLLGVLPGVVPFARSGICRGLPWRVRTVGAVAVFRQRVQKYTISKKRLVFCTPLCGVFFLFLICFLLCAFLCVLRRDAFFVGLFLFDAGRSPLCILHSLSI